MTTALATSPHHVPKAKQCHCSPHPHHPCPHTKAELEKAAAAKKKAAATASRKLAHMSAAQKKALAAKRRKAAAKAAETRKFNTAMAAKNNPHKPPAAKPKPVKC